MTSIATTRLVIRSRQIKTKVVSPEDRLSAIEKVICWATTLGLTLWVATNWLNLRWVLGIFQLAIFASTIVILCLYARRGQSRSFRIRTMLVFSLPVFGLLQMLLGRTAYQYAAMLAVLDWTTFACLTYLGALLLREGCRRIYFFRTLMILSAAITAMELYQIFELGRYAVLSTGFPLLSSNGYAELAELLLPINLFLMSRRLVPEWIPIVLSAFTVTTVIASGARAGSILICAEVLLFLALSLRSRKSQSIKTLNPVIVTVTVTALLTLITGAGILKLRFVEARPLEHRQDILVAAYQMIKQHPLTGVGFGCFSVVYPQFQQYDSTYFINHVHNDYVEMATEGGVTLLALFIAFVLVSLKKGICSSWGVGCIGILIHATTDFPMYRPQVAGLFAILIAGIAEIGLQKFSSRQ